ncbi:MAG: citrate synthase, partial [Planctomycetaceae bacterium]|nr:citrate synthase [Planctomycetaceae bacterium]
MTTESEKPAVVRGLKGVNVADSTICLVNGTEGKLLYRGYNIDDLATQGTFEEVAYLLFQGELPNTSQLDQFKAQLAESATLPEPVIEFLKTLPQSALPMSALRSAVSVAGIYDPQSEDETPEGNLRKSIRLTAQVATIVAAIRRLRDGNEPVAPKPELGFAANLMYMLNGSEPTPDAAKAMDLILILHAEHGLNASTFTARVISATLTDLYSAITGAVGALKGKLHGGASTEVLNTLKQVGSVENIAP